MKSAYELALERMSAAGIEPPREDALSPALREEIAQIRARAEAELANLEILYRDRLPRMAYADREKAEEQYGIDRGRVIERRDRDIEKVRRGAS